MKNGMKAMLLSRGSADSRNHDRDYRNDRSREYRGYGEAPGGWGDYYGDYDDRSRDRRNRYSEYGRRDYDRDYGERENSRYAKRHARYDYDPAEDDDPTVDEHKAREWVKRMSSGEHFKPEITDQMRAAICPDCERWEFYAAMNAMYSDHYKTAQKMSVDKADFYAHLAKDFLKDTDAKPNKLYRYMTMLTA